MKKKLTYKQAGVDIEAGADLVEVVKEMARSTFRPEVLTGIGGFGGLFSFDTQRYYRPVLVSATDGVGTKLKIAQMTGEHSTVGIDLVAMCANDVVVQGAEPLFFLDYLAVGKLIPEREKAILSGVAEGCRQAGCALLGGETAEMAGFYKEDEYDLAGFAVGVVEREKIIDGSKIQAGDVILGLASSGLHSNGYSLVRKVFLERQKLDLAEKPEGLKCSLGEELLKPTKIYVKPLLKLVSFCEVHGLAHITGGGLIDNITRILPSGLEANLKPESWPTPPIFKLVQKGGEIDELEMYRTFNMGLGMAAVLAKSEAGKAAGLLRKMGENIFEVGEVREGKRGVRFG